MKEFDAETVNKMLVFIYSDKLEEPEIDMELLGIANMYQIEALQISCERKLSNDLDVNNCMDCWVGANLFDRQTFLEICESFIIANWLEIQETESFTRVMKENSESIAPLIVKMLNIYSTSKTKVNTASRQ